MKKIINKVDMFVLDMMHGIIKSNAKLSCDLEKQTIYKTKINKNKVSLISGGGSGHEPAHAGYIGTGMLDAAVCGMVFTSPTPEMVESAINNTQSDKGTLLIVKNYSGDVMNFEIAKDLANDAGQKVEHVIVNDDVTAEKSEYSTGRRGIAGTVFVHKIAGALAETGAELEEVKKVAEKVIENVRSMGMSLGGATLPADGKKSFELAEDEMEIGLGIHGEKGIKKEKIKSSKEIVIELLDKIISDDVDYLSGNVALMINGLGGTPQSELFIAANNAHDYLKKKNIKITHTKVGNFMTSLEMPGFSISLLKLDKETEKLLDAATDAPAW